MASVFFFLQLASVLLLQRLRDRLDDLVVQMSWRRNDTLVARQGTASGEVEGLAFHVADDASRFCDQESSGGVVLWAR